MGLFYKLFPDETVSCKGDPCHGSRKVKTNYSFLHNGGSEIIKPLVIGKWENFDAVRFKTIVM